jgi:hypothetical protein
MFFYKNYQIPYFFLHKKRVGHHTILLLKPFPVKGFRRLPHPLAFLKHAYFGLQQEYRRCNFVSAREKKTPVHQSAGH